MLLFRLQSQVGSAIPAYHAEDKTAETAALGICEDCLQPSQHNVAASLWHNTGFFAGGKGRSSQYGAVGAKVRIFVRGGVRIFGVPLWAPCWQGM